MAQPTTKVDHRPEGEADGITVAEILNVLSRFRWLILGVTVAITAGVTLWTLRQPAVYRATCTIEYDPSPARPLGDEVEDIDQLGSYWATQEFLQTQNHIISSRAVLEAVVSDFGLNDASGSTIEAAALELQSRLTVEPEENTHLVHIHVEDVDPGRAQALANAIADAYIRKTVEDRSQSSVQATTWLETQLDDVDHRLRSSEGALHAFKQDHDILSVSMEDRQNIVASSIETFSGALAEARIERVRLQARLTQLRIANQADALDVRAGQLDENPTVQALHEQYNTNAAELESLATRYGPAHPRIQELTAEQTRIREDLRHELDGLIRSAEADLAEAREIEGGLARALEQANHDGLELNALEIEYNRLSRERENEEHLYNLLLERTTEADLMSAMRVRHVAVLDRAIRPTSPIRPRVSLNVGAGLGAGLALAIALAFLASRLDRRVRSAEQVEALGLSLLGVVPHFVPDAPGAPGAARRRRREGAGATAEATTNDLVVHSHPMSLVAEYCRSIRTNLMFSSADTPLRRIVITSAGPEDGKTFVSLSLATVLAQSGKTVLIVDTDLRRPRVHRAVGVPNRAGLTNWIVGNATLDEIINETPVSGLHMVTSGPIPPNPSELLHSTRFSEFLTQLGDKYDHVIFDSPPLGAVTDAAVLAPQLDGVVLVVRASRTTTDAIRSVVRHLRELNARLIGGVLNDVDLTKTTYGGYMYQKAYYYGSRDDEPAASE